MNKEIQNIINDIEKVCRVTQDQYFVIKSSEHQVYKKEIDDLKSQRESMLYHINKMFGSKLYKFFIRHFAKRFKANMKHIRLLLNS